MPVVLPDSLPAAAALAEENIFVMSEARARTQDIRPLRILMVNLMPAKETTETQIARLLANSPLQVRLDLLKTATHESRHVEPAHLAAFYKTFPEVKENRYDGMIVTGAPVETLAFEDVDYWQELSEILDWSATHVYSVLYVCWGALAGLHHHYGIGKTALPQKLSGVYRHRVVRRGNPLLRGFDDEFFMPQSRHAGLCVEDLARCPALRVLAEGKEAGPAILSVEDGRRIFVTGHPEYDRGTLDAEYRRDIAKGMDVPVPVNYYEDDDPAKGPVFRWRSHAHLLYQNWLNYYVYQSTPYDLADLPPLMD